LCTHIFFFISRLIKYVNSLVEVLHLVCARASECVHASIVGHESGLSPGVRPGTLALTLDPLDALVRVQQENIRRGAVAGDHYLKGVGLQNKKSYLYPVFHFLSACPTLSTPWS